MKKILYIIDADQTSGSGKCALKLIEFASKKNFIPIVITKTQNNLNKYLDKLHIENYAIHYASTCSFGMGILGWFIALMARPILNFLAVKQLRNKISLNDVAIVHSNSSTIDFGAYLHKKYSIPHIWHIREFLVFEKQLKPIIFNLPSYIQKNSTTTITVSNKLKNFISSKADFGKIETIYDGIPTTFTSNKTKKNNDILKIVCIGNYAQLKGQDIVLEALHLLKNEYLEKISIDFYGNNLEHIKEYLFQLVKKYSLEKKVHIHDFIENVQTKLVDYDIGIQPSHSEGFSLVTAEYMIAGLCVIGNGDTAIAELIEHKKTGLLYNDYNIQKLADYIVFCIRNRDKAREMGKKAQKFAVNNFSLNNNFEKLSKIYEQIIK